MSARDELVGIVMEEATDNGLYMGTLTAADIADAVIAWGFRKPRTITADDEIDRLAEGAVVLDKYGVANQLVIESISEGRPERCWDTTGHDRNSSVALPATVLYEP